MRLEAPGEAAWPAVQDEGELEMHDGARFRVGVLDALGAEDGGQEFRLKLLGKGGSS